MNSPLYGEPLGVGKLIITGKRAPAAVIFESAGCKATSKMFYAGSSFHGEQIVPEAQTCLHVKEIGHVTPSGTGCKECLEMGDKWLHLRMCLICGHVGCCDSSKNKHATKHFHHTKHPVMQSAEPGENWKWCYVDEIFLT